MEDIKRSQNRTLLQYLEAGNSITPAEAMELFAIGHLARRVCDLREAGHNIVTVMESGKNRFGHPVRYARYSLRKEAAS